MTRDYKQLADTLESLQELFPLHREPLAEVIQVLRQLYKVSESGALRSTVGLLNMAADLTNIEPVLDQLFDRLVQFARFKHAVIEALVVNHVYTSEHEQQPEKALADLIHWETKIALDPAVSQQAQALKDEGQALGLAKAGHSSVVQALKILGALGYRYSLVDDAWIAPDGNEILLESKVPEAIHEFERKMSQAVLDLRQALEGA